VENKGGRKGRGEEEGGEVGRKNEWGAKKK